MFLLQYTLDSADGTLKDWKFFMNINVLAQCVCSREAYRSMSKNNINGHIIQINR